VKVRLTLENGYVLEGELVVGNYHTSDDVTCLMLQYPDGYDVLSVNLVAYDMLPPPGHVYLKDSGDWSGMADQLEKLGFVKLLTDVPYGPFDSKAKLAKLTLPD
jgi:hypothetical protein